MTDALRRSGREKKRNPRYAFEPLEAEDLENLDPPSEDSTVSSFEDIENKEGEEEDNVLVASEDELLGQDFEDVDGLEDEPNDNEDDLASLEITTVIRPARLKTKQTSSKKIRKQSTKKGRASFREDAVRSRGLLLHASVISKETTVSELAGYDEVLTHKMRIERSKYGGTITLPFREGIGHGKSGMEYPEIYDQEIRENERQAYLNWYYDNGGWQIMAKVQSTSSLEVGSRNIYIPINLPAQDILLGPYNAQHHFVLPNHDSISVSEAWKTAITNTTDSEEYDEAASDRQSWILNLGLRILALDWAANRSGEYQYLAVSTDQARPDHIARVSALGAEEPFEAAVQIWAFKTRNKDEATIMDLSEKPQLVHVICANWGTIRRLSWCPAGTLIEENSDSIGTLAMITSDGYIRVIDVCVDATSSNPYVKYESAAFASSPPDTICTCLTWLSADLLVAGCSDGHVAIWSMTKCLQAQRIALDATGQSSSSVPFWYHSLHSTYIISVAAHQPYPGEYITTNGVDGKVRLTSIRNPYSDSAYGSRERHLMPPLVYSPHILGIYEIDETDGLRARPLRHMPVSRAVGRAPAQVLCIDAGKVHPTLLFGCADGNAILTNPMRRMYIRRLTDERVEAWQQTWFRHEFVPTNRSQPTDYTTSLQRDLQGTSYIRPRPGTSRFLESFKLEAVSLMRNIQPIKDDNSKKRQDPEAGVEAASFSSPEKKKKKTKQRRQQEEENIVGFEDVQVAIFEEEQAVTCLCWNPNIQTGGWAAAGMANGLIRVEDLAV